MRYVHEVTEKHLIKWMSLRIKIFLSIYLCVFRDALTKASLSQPVLKNLCLYVAQDCTGKDYRQVL